MGRGEAQSRQYRHRRFRDRSPDVSGARGRSRPFFVHGIITRGRLYPLSFLRLRGADPQICGGETLAFAHSTRLIKLVWPLNCLPRCSSPNNATLNSTLGTGLLEIEIQLIQPSSALV